MRNPTLAINDLLLPANFMKAKQRLAESPEHLTLFERKWFNRSEALNSNIGLDENWRLYTPILLMDMTACGVFFIMPSLEMWSYEMAWQVSGVVGNFWHGYDNIIIVNTIAELLYVRYRTEYENVILLPSAVYQPFFKKFRDVIFLHHDEKRMSSIWRKVKCFFLEAAYEWEELWIPEIVSFDDYTQVNHNPFVLDWRLTFMISYKSRQLVNSLSSYNTQKQDDWSTKVNHETWPVYINADTIPVRFLRKQVTTNECYKEVKEYIKWLFPYWNNEEIMVITYYLMYLWVWPLFQQMYNLNIYTSSWQLLLLTYWPLHNLTPSTHLSYSTPWTWYDNAKEIDVSARVPMISFHRTFMTKMFWNWIPLVWQARDPLRRVVDNFWEYLKVRNTLVNWAMDYEKLEQIRISNLQDPYLDIFWYLVPNHNDLGKIRNTINNSKEILNSIKKWENYDHYHLI